jgi:hypothetical protein
MTQPFYFIFQIAKLREGGKTKKKNIFPCTRTYARIYAYIYCFIIKIIMYVTKTDSSIFRFT